MGTTNDGAFWETPTDQFNRMLDLELRQRSVRCQARFDRSADSSRGLLIRDGNPFDYRHEEAGRFHPTADPSTSIIIREISQAYKGPKIENWPLVRRFEVW